MNDEVDFGAVTKVQQQTWSEGDFAMVANLVYQHFSSPLMTRSIILRINSGESD